MFCMYSTFSGCKKTLKDLWSVSPVRGWYSRSGSGGSFLFDEHRSQQSCISRFASGHLRNLSYGDGQEVLRTCTRCVWEEGGGGLLRHQVCSYFKLSCIYSGQGFFRACFLFGLFDGLWPWSIWVDHYDQKQQQITGFLFQPLYVVVNFISIP